ncbi:hypothetical protein PTTG_29438, partial [Puccinia triticina 1-1 BBBD Race 1]
TARLVIARKLPQWLYVVPLDSSKLLRYSLAWLLCWPRLPFSDTQFVGYNSRGLSRTPLPSWPVPVHAKRPPFANNSLIQSEALRILGLPTSKRLADPLPFPQNPRSRMCILSHWWAQARAGPRRSSSPSAFLGAPVVLPSAKTDDPDEKLRMRTPTSAESLRPALLDDGCHPYFPGTPWNQLELAATVDPSHHPSPNPRRLRLRCFSNILVFKS